MQTFNRLTLLLLAPAFGLPLAFAQIADPSLGGNTRSDLTGIWMQVDTRPILDIDTRPPLTDWAKARLAANRPTLGSRAVLDANDPTLNCLPPGVPYILVVPLPFEIVQTSREVAMLFEYDHNVRRIYMDGRLHPNNLQQTEGHQWMGHSTGFWDHEILQIDTVGFSDKTWLDRLGHPHSDGLKLTERLRRVTHELLEYNVSITDPQAYRGVWHGQKQFELKSDWEILDHACAVKDPNYLRYQKKAWKPLRK